jgi:HKD family nuclease
LTLDIEGIQNRHKKSLILKTKKLIQAWVGSGVKVDEKFI